MLFLFLAALLAVLTFLSACLWMFDVWKKLTVDEIIYTISVSTAGTDREILMRYVRGYLPFLLLTAAALIILTVYALKKGFKRRAAQVFAVLFVLTGIGVFSLLETKLGLWSYVLTSHEDSDFIQEHYTDPAEAQIVFPEKKRNLVYIYLESMETTYTDPSVGGAFEQNVIPELTKLALENCRFTDSRGMLNGGISLTGSTWTMGAMFAQSTGLPLKTYIEKNEMGELDEFFPGVTAIGDILEKEGYNQELLLGSDVTFGGRSSFYFEHGNYQIFDYYTAVAKGYIPKDYFQFWGFEDEKLFEYARLELERLSKEDRPFNLTLLTVDTHFEDGYTCRLCRDDFGDNQYANVMACSSRQVADFVNWIKEQPFYEDTAIVISGDHPTMDADFCDGVPESYERKTYVTFINSAMSYDQDRTREYSTMDLFPTTLSAMGVAISEDRLGLGVDLYSMRPTLVEVYGRDYLDAQLQHKSELLTRLSEQSIPEVNKKYFSDNAITSINSYNKETDEVEFESHTSGDVTAEGIERVWGEITMQKSGEKLTTDAWEVENVVLERTAAGVDMKVVTDMSGMPHEPFELKVMVRYIDGDERELDCYVYDRDKACTFAGYLNELDLDRCTVFIAIRDEGTKDLREDDFEALKRLGIKTDLQFHTRASFLAVVGGDVYDEQILMSKITREGTFCGGKHRYVIESAGYEAGDSCSIQIDGVEYAPNRRGMNIVVFDNEEEKVTDVALFDTYINANERIVNYE